METNMWVMTKVAGAFWLDAVMHGQAKWSLII